MIYVEDYLQHYVEVVGVTDSNKQILESINRQLKKGMGLTDRQYELVVKIMEGKVENFTGNEPLRVPLRQIDRSKYITVVTTDEVYRDQVYESYKGNWQWIKIRFPFAKKTIVSVESVASKHRKKYFHRKGSHEHFFKLTELTVKDICNEFIKKDFIIDEYILELYNQILDVENNIYDYVPSYVNKEVKNINIELSNLLPYQILDRKRQLGLQHVDCEIPSGILGTICNREDVYLQVKPSSISFDALVGNLVKLDRFPILAVITPGNELDQMTTIYNAFRHVVADAEHCALFRVENQGNDYNVNNFIHDKSLNNWLDNNTKIVYIKSDKLPKLLVKESWVPQCVLSLDSTRKNSNVTTYCKDTCDLIIDFDEQPSVWRGYSFGNM